MTLGKRIRQKRKEAGLTIQNIADIFGISRGAVSDWENDNTRPDQNKLPALARKLRTTIAYLLDNDTNAEPEFRGISDNLAYFDAKAQQPVPLISWVRAGEWDVANDPYPVDGIEEWKLCPVRHSPSTYALRVTGDSMTSAYGRTYPNGCLIFVDPALRSPVSGDRIIAKLEGSDEVTFKVFVNEGGKFWLKPLNPQYPIITEPFKVLGTVIGKWEDG